jgi:hypothetical protein
VQPPQHGLVTPPALACGVVWAYLEQGPTSRAGRGLWPVRDQVMQPLSPPKNMATNMATAAPRPSAVASVIVAAAAALVALLAVGAVGLWVHYGTAVFFEMIKSGIAACI